MDQRLALCYVLWAGLMVVFLIGPLELLLIFPELLHILLLKLVQVLKRVLDFLLMVNILRNLDQLRFDRLQIRDALQGYSLFLEKVFAIKNAVFLCIWFCWNVKSV